ncbi:MAG: DUF3422 domain-containing protein, partial [Rhodospirillales bacterium]|nr:DUF3422 domain-containing protein [Rhodospirillales bacterium]
LELVPRDWLESLPGECLVALHVAVEARERGTEELARFFDGNLIMGSEVLSGAARAWTDFRMHDGFGRFLVADHGLLPGQAGRLVQRLLEIETYRMMALLAFPLARETQPRISTVDAGLSEIIHRMAEGTAGDSDRALLERLTALAADVERISAATTYRFSASRAYYGLVERRIRELREERLAGTQTIGEFMERRLGPAMATCLSTAERHEALSRRIARAGDLLRTRVDIALEEKNRDLLLSMNRRAALQLRLQETVEGLSVVAIAKAAGVPINPDLAVFLGFPVLVAMIWLGVKRLRKAIVAEEEGHE